MRSNADVPEELARIAPTTTAVFGSTRSGKTTSTGRALIRTWLDPGDRRTGWFKKRPAREPPGMLALTVKVNEAENIALTAELAGRGLDVIRVSAGGEWSGDPLASYFRLPGASAAAGAKLLGELAELVTRNSGHSSEPFWVRARERTLFFCLVILKAAYRRPRFDALYAFLSALPYGREDMAEGGGFHRGAAAGAAQLAVSNVPPADEGELKRALQWLLTEWPATPDKLRESVRQEALSVVFPATQSPLDALFRGDSLTPDLLDDGRVVILDLPLLKYGAAGAIFQGAWKMCVDLAMVQRGRGARTVIRWTDEVQWLLLPEWDSRIATVSSESNYFQVNLTQTLPTMYAALGGESARHQVASLLANSPLKIAHYTDCYETGKFFSDMLGQKKELMYGGGTSSQGYDLFDDLTGNHKPQANVSFTAQYQPVFRPEGLMRFRRGGKENGFVCDCLLTLAGQQPRVVSVPQTLI